MNTLFLSLVCSTLLPLLDGPDQKAIDGAIDKGVAYLKDQLSQNKIADVRVRAFTAYALAHCGVAPNDAVLKPVIDEILTAAPKDTYHAAIIIMALSYFDPDNDKYRERIAECAQLLVGSQTPDGQWSYELGRKAERGDSGQIYTGKKKQKGDIFIRPAFPYLTSTTLANNSTSQYATLGLHAAAKARVYAPKETWKLSYDYWVNSRNDDGGWGYVGKLGSKGTAADANGQTSPYSAVWFDGKHAQRDYVSSYGNMTCAAISGLAIATANLGKNHLKDRAFQEGMKWLEKNFSIETIPGKVLQELAEKNKIPHYYYFYSLERACAVAAVASVGSHDWYGGGAEFILKAQAAEGSWTSQDHLSPHTTTAYAILFLKRASTGLIETGTGKGK